MEYKTLVIPVFIEASSHYFIIQIKQFILNCTIRPDNTIRVYINRYETEDIAIKIAHLAIQTGSYETSGFVRQVVSGAYKALEECGLEHFAMFCLNKQSPRFYTDHFSNDCMYIDEKHMNELCEILSQDNSKTYCIECGISIFKPSEKCWACEHGI